MLDVACWTRWRSKYFQLCSTIICTPWCTKSMDGPQLDKAIRTWEIYVCLSIYLSNLIWLSLLQFGWPCIFLLIISNRNCRRNHQKMHVAYTKHSNSTHIVLLVIFSRGKWWTETEGWLKHQGQLQQLLLHFRGCFSSFLQLSVTPRYVWTIRANPR